MADQVTCAVFGLGSLGWRHAANLAGRIPGARLVAVVDVIAERARQFASEFDVPHIASTPDEALDDPDIKAVVIATPTTSHAPLVRSALAAGKAVFVEKPITQTLAEADAVRQAVQSSGAFCQVGFMRRYDPAYATAAEQIRKGAIGRPIYFKAISRDPDAPPEHYIRDSGRIFADQSIHDYDIARFLVADEITDVTAVGSNLQHPYLAPYSDLDQALTIVRFAGGAFGDIEASRNAGYGYDIRAEVLGTEGTLQIGSWRHHNVRLLSNRQAASDIIPGYLERFADAYMLEMVDFIDRVRRGEPPVVTAEDGYRALAVAMAAAQSFDEGHAVRVA